MAEGERTILYYPYVRPKADSWLRHALLYWDRVAAFVPETLDYRSNVVPSDTNFPVSTPETEYLRDQGVFFPVRPELVLQRQDRLAEALNEKFVSLVSSASFANARREPHTFWLHEDKGNLWMWKRLLDAQLADRAAPGVQVGPTVGLYYLSLLAEFLCHAEKTSMVPGTDESRYEDWLFPRTSHGERLACLDVAFERILPVPADDVPLDDILAFRAEHRIALLRFRQELDRISQELSASTSQHQMNEVVTVEKENLEIQLAELGERLRSSRIRGRLGNLKTLIALVGGGVVSTISAPVGAAGAAIAVASSMRESSDEPDELARGSALSYVHEAKDAGILS